MCGGAAAGAAAVAAAVAAVAASASCTIKLLKTWLILLLPQSWEDKTQDKSHDKRSPCIMHGWRIMQSKTISHNDSPHKLRHSKTGGGLKVGRGRLKLLNGGARAQKEIVQNAVSLSIIYKPGVVALNGGLLVATYTIKLFISGA